MPVLSELHDTFGQPLICESDGTFAFSANAGRASTAHIATCGVNGWALLETVCTLAELAESPCRLLALWVETRANGLCVLRLRPFGPFVCLSGTSLTKCDGAEDATEFSLGRPDVVRRNGILATISDGVTFDEAGLSDILSSGDPEMLPVVEALLTTLTAAEVRTAWSRSTRTPDRDIFFQAIYAHGRRSLANFNAYTADLLRHEIQTHGWSIGKKTYGVPTVFEAGRGHLSIGHYCSLANPTIVLGNHNTCSATTYAFVDLWAEWPGTMPGMTDHQPGNVTIGNDVWIGASVIILPGSVISDGAIIGAGAVVRGTIPPYSVCIGNPASVHRLRFDADTVARFLRVRWWDWPEAMVDRYVGLLVSEDTEAFLVAAETEMGLS